MLESIRAKISDSIKNQKSLWRNKRLRNVVDEQRIATGAVDNSGNVYSAESQLKIVTIDGKRYLPVDSAYFDRFDYDKKEAAIQVVNETFGTQVGNGTVYTLNSEELTALARVLFDNPKISFARQLTETGLNGYTYSFIEAFVSIDDQS